ncbi:MAG: nitrous oxide reductase family maturation protein NosD [Bacteroidia bacterium]|nr:nitrous oxide reductase family maturation protein NosD [Bacteroidia bacterium]
MKKIAFWIVGTLLSACLNAREWKADNTRAFLNALNASSGGDVITLLPGVYQLLGTEIIRPITIRGEGRVYLDGNNGGTILKVFSDSVTLENLVIRNTGVSYTEDRAGILIKKSESCVVKNCILLNCFFGIYLSHVQKSRLTGNIIRGSAKSETRNGNGIQIFTCNGIVVSGNYITRHRDGIYIEFSEKNSFSGNISRQNVRYGLHFMFSGENEYRRNSFSDNGAGVAVMYSKKIVMKENVFADNWSSISNGILLKDISDSYIGYNIFRRNPVGIYSEGVLRTSITNNYFINNGWALKILGNCEENAIRLNNFMSNTFEVVTNSAHNRNNFAENYWSDYSGYDMNKDGVGDIPHRPVKLFTYLVEEVPASVILMRSLFVNLLDVSEKITPVLTPELLLDQAPRMKEIKW